MALHEDTGFRRWWDQADGWLRLFFCVVVGFVLYLADIALCCTHASQEVVFCQIRTVRHDDGSPPVYRLVGLREWREEITEGFFPTFDEAVKAAERVRCPLK